MDLIDRFLNKLTMYRLVVYVLSVYAALGVIFAFMGRLSVSPTQLVTSLLLLVTSAYLTDRVFGRLFRLPTNMESSLITALILFLIVQPAHAPMGGLALALAGAVSSASKFLITWNGKHLFNPAAFAAALLSLTGLQATTWWVGSSLFWPATLVLGLLVVRKIRRFPLWLTFVGVSTALQLLQFAAEHADMGVELKHALIASPLLFLSTIMLTEPATMPPRRNLQIAFAGLVATLYVYAWKLGPITLYPEVALLVGNLFAFVVSPKLRVRLHLKEIQKISDRVYNYVFQPERRFAFLPGQYMEWTLDGVPYDARGNRRTFTIASSPTEAEVHLGLKYYEPASQYKAAFERLRPGDSVYASQLAGNFTINGREKQKLVFIAGGIGITPFRSMVKYLIDQNQSVDILLLYAVGDPREFAYLEQFKAAREVGVRFVPIVTNPAHTSADFLTSRIDADLLVRLVPDHAERTFYVSGPDTMVDGVRSQLKQMGVPGRRIKTDHFAGY
jgi:ferredoxin-NADP reductase